MSRRLSIKQVVFVLLALATVAATFRPVASVAGDAVPEVDGDASVTTLVPEIDEEIVVDDTTTTTVPDETTTTTVAPDETTTTTVAPEEPSDDGGAGDDPVVDPSDDENPAPGDEPARRLVAPAIAPQADKPVITVAKDVVAGPVLNGAGGYDVVYTVTVDNSGGAGSYDLVDELQLGDGITVRNARVTAAQATNPSWDGVTATTVASKVSIGAGDTHVYTVAVEAEAAVTVTPAAADCSLGDGEYGTGFLNLAMAVVGSKASTATDCAPLPEPEIGVEKRVTAGPTPTGDGAYEIEYTIAVINDGAGPGTYDLADTLRFGDGIAVARARVQNAEPGDVTTNPDWDGIDDIAVTTGIGIAAGDTHVYVVRAKARVGTHVTAAAADCRRTQGEDGTGFLNEAAVVVGGDGSHDRACAEVPTAELSMAKTLVSGPTRNASGTYDLVYEIAVDNSGRGAGRYDLSDRIRFGDGISVVAAQVGNLQPGTVAANPSWDGVSDTAVASAVAIAAGASHTYRVAVEAAVIPTVTRSASDCSLEQSEAGTGFLNEASVVVGSSLLDDEDCADVPNSSLHLSKTLVGGPTLNGDGTYDLAYDIVVANDGEGPGTYDVDDRLLWGDGMTLVSGSVSNPVPGGIALNPGWNGTTDTRVASGVGIAAGATHRYRVSVEASVATTITAEAADCALYEHERGTGALNQATLTVDDRVLLSDDCGELPDPAIHVAKTVTGGPALAADGSYDVTYQVTVTNTGQGPGSYDLDDELLFGGDVSVNSASVSSVAGGTATNPGWDGIADTTVVTGAGIAAGDTHVFEVAVNASVAVTISRVDGDCVVTTTEAGSGFLNSAEITVDGETEEASDCTEVPSNTLELAKTLTAGPTRNQDGTYQVTYEVTVTNVGDGPGSYDLDDELRYGDGVVVEDATVANTAPGAIATNAAWDGVTDTRVATGVAIAPGDSHVYTVGVTASVTPALTEADGDCDLTAGEDGTGYLNTATLTADGGETEASDCAGADPLEVLQPEEPEEPQGPGDPELPMTGIPTQLLVWIGLAMLLGGATLIRTVRQTAPEAPGSGRRDEDGTGAAH